MRLLIGVLSEILNSDDPRWLDFGLEMPSKKTTPAAPTGLAVVAAPAHLAAEAAVPNATLVLVTCDPQPSATRYRFRMRASGLLGSKYELVASTRTPLAQINVPANSTVEFIAQAANGNRQGVASDPVSFTVPLAEAARMETIAPLATIAPDMSKSFSTKTNGNGNVTAAAPSPHVLVKF